MKSLKKRYLPIFSELNRIISLPIGTGTETIEKKFIGTGTIGKKLPGPRPGSGPFEKTSGTGAGTGIRPDLPGLGSGPLKKRTDRN
jgi:hypothetical protein